MDNPPADDPFAFARHDDRGTDRLESFCDGVFATAGTLLIFSFIVPEVSEGGAQALINALLEQTPVYVGLLISFILIGSTWAHHHEMFRYIRKSDHTLLLLSILMMVTVVVVPFSTNLLATFIDDPEQGRVGATIYAGAWLTGAIFWNLTWRHAVRANLLDPEMPPQAVREVTRQYYGGPLLYGASFVASFFSLPLAVILFILPGLYYMLPPHFFRDIRRWFR